MRWIVTGHSGSARDGKGTGTTASRDLLRLIRTAADLLAHGLYTSVRPSPAAAAACLLPA